MTTVYLIVETVYGNSYTDSETIFACFDVDQRDREIRRLEEVRRDKMKWEYSYSTDEIVITEE